MGGDHDRLGAAAAASVLGWWIEAGVNVAIQEQPRSWLGAADSTAADLRPVEAPVAPQELPAGLEAFSSWLRETPTLPLARAGARRVLPRGSEAPEVMMLADMPSAEDITADQPIGGQAWELATRMLAAIGLTPEHAYVANLTCVHSPGARLSSQDLEACAAIVRRQIALVKPKRLLLFGDGPCRALLGRPLAAARGHVHKVEGVRTVASFHPRWLLERASDKARAWSDLLLLMEEEL